jgi:hypothetical protein
MPGAVGRLSQAISITAPATLAVVSFLLTAAGIMPWLGLLVAVAALLAAWRPGGTVLLGANVGPRAVLAAGFLAHALPAAAHRWALLIVGVILLGLLLHEGPLRAVSAPLYQLANVTPAVRAGHDRTSRAVWLTNSVLVLAVGLFAVTTWPVWPLLVASALGFALSSAVFVRAWNGGRRRRADHLRELTDLVERHQPRFLLYFSAPPGSHYQASMWLPYLERLGEPFIVVLRESHSLEPISSATGAPVVVCPSLAALDAVMVPTISAAFYVNNGMKNSHCVRFSHLTHVQLLHGESDKASSHNPVTAMYDRVFVAGQAGVDRYSAAGVDIPRQKFRIVGRPQVEGVEVSTGPVANDATGRTVLYAPTWVGYYSDVNYSSLPIGERIVGQLLARGVTVIFRHHPYAKRDHRSAAQIRRIEHLLDGDRARNGRPHLWGTEACERLSLTDCINRSDAMMSDVSAVAADYLFSQKPFAIADMVDEGDEFVNTFSLARGAYIIRSDGGNLDSVLSDLLERDPLAATRRQMRTYYLGDFPPDRYSEAFLEEARRSLDRVEPPGRVSSPALQPAVSTGEATR